MTERRLSTFLEFDQRVQRFQERLKPQIMMKVKGETVIFRTSRRMFQQMGLMGARA